MRVLIIDNNSKHIQKLRKLLAQHETELVRAEDLSSLSNLRNFDLYVLSGGKGRAVVRNRRYYQAERELIKTTNRPVIGICLGAEMIADTLGGQLVRLLVRRRLYNGVVFDDKSRFGPATGKVWGYQAHHWAIQSVSSAFIVHATSRDGIELFEHRDRPLFGLQFHPEVHYGSKHGAHVFEKILADIIERTARPAQNLPKLSRVR